MTKHYADSRKPLITIWAQENGPRTPMEGAMMVALDESLKILKCGLQNEIVIEHTSDVTIIIRNSSTETVSISPGQDMCLLRYV